MPAGSYGLHMIPGQEEWTVVFSKNFTSWGSFFYDPSDDALRVKVKPQKSEYHEWLEFEFPERKLDRATVAMRWEDLQVPITITVDDVAAIYLDGIRKELRGAKGFAWVNWNAGARYALQNNDPKDALEWAKVAAKPTFPGQENFTTLMTLADAEEANAMQAEAKTARDKAMNLPGAGAAELHQYARGLQQKGKKEEALGIFELNAKRHPNEWPVNVGLARGYSAVGRYKDALKYARLALAQAPDDTNRNFLKAGIEKLEQGRDLN